MQLPFEVDFKNTGQQDTTETKRAALIVAGVLFVALLWVLTIFSSGANDPANSTVLRGQLRQHADVANFFLWMLIISLMVFFVQGTLADFGAIGTKQQIFIGVVVGGGIALLASALNFFIAPASISGLIEPLKFFYVVLVSPAVEEIFFRAVLPYTIFRWSNNWIYALLIPAFLFGAWHFYVDMGSIASFFSHFVFAIIATILYTMSGTIAAPFMYHAVNNAQAIG